MRIRRHLSYANVIATLALVLSLAGGAYAITRVGSHDIVNGSIRSIDLRNRKAVKGADVKRDALTGRQINENTLAGNARVAGTEGTDCDPASTTSYTDCAKVMLRLKQRSRVLVLATGNEESVGGAAQASCHVRIDNKAESLGLEPGEEITDNTSGTATNGFARTVVTSEPLRLGHHEVALACKELAGNVRIDAPTIAAIAIGSR